jgi:hypothetical protein
VVASSVLPSYNPSNPEEGKEEWLSRQGIARCYSDMRRIKGNVPLFSFSFPLKHVLFLVLRKLRFCLNGRILLHMNARTQKNLLIGIG